MASTCPEESLLQELAAGLVSPEAAEKHLAHIAQCGQCGAGLRLYLSLFSDELTTDEQAILSELNTSKPEGQRAMVRKLLWQSGWTSRIRLLMHCLKRSLKLLRARPQ